MPCSNELSWVACSFAVIAGWWQAHDEEEEEEEEDQGLLALSLCQVSDSVLVVLHASVKMSLAYN